jgi:hypothetical protein
MYTAGHDRRACTYRVFAARRFRLTLLPSARTSEKPPSPAEGKEFCAAVDTPRIINLYVHFSKKVDCSGDCIFTTVGEVALRRSSKTSP